MIPKIIETERLILRPPQNSDADQIAPRITHDVAHWLARMPYPYSRADAMDWLSAFEKDPDKAVWAITLDGRYIGSIGLEREFGYWLAQDRWGQGLMSEAGRAVLDAYFSDPAAGPLASGYFIGNERSANVLRKLGFGPKAAPILRYNLAQDKDLPLQQMYLTPEQWHFLNPVEIETERLRIRPNEAHHITAIHAITAQQKVAQNLGSFPHPLDVAFIEERLERGRWRGGWNGWFHIADPAGAVLGMIGFYSPTQGQEDDIGIGYALDPKAWGQGIMSEALRAFCDFIFNRYRAGKIQASCFDDNPASQRVLEKAGFEPFEKDMEKSAARSEKSPITRYRLMWREGAFDGTGH